MEAETLDQSELEEAERLTGPQATRVEAAYAAIKDLIRNGTFPPAFQASELEIANRLGMSRTPVHQAIVQLQGEGMVELRAKRGVVVSALDIADMREIYDVVAAVEGMAASLGAARRLEERESVCDALSGCNNAMKVALHRDDLAEWASFDTAFHGHLVASAGNRRLERIARVNLDQSFRARRLTLGLRPKPVHSIDEHQGIIDAIAAGDSARAQQAAQSHKERARELIICLLERYDIKHL